jgi:hypothetical protein
MTVLVATERRFHSRLKRSWTLRIFNGSANPQLKSMTSAFALGVEYRELKEGVLERQWIDTSTANFKKYINSMPSLPCEEMKLAGGGPECD